MTEIGIDLQRMGGGHDVVLGVTGDLQNRKVRLTDYLHKLNVNHSGEILPHRAAMSLSSRTRCGLSSNQTGEERMSSR